jgi:hypothetical protein
MLVFMTAHVVPVRAVCYCCTHFKPYLIHIALTPSYCPGIPNTIISIVPQHPHQHCKISNDIFIFIMATIHNSIHRRVVTLKPQQSNHIQNCCLPCHHTIITFKPEMPIILIILIAYRTCQRARYKPLSILIESGLVKISYKCAITSV